MNISPVLWLLAPLLSLAVCDDSLLVHTGLGWVQGQHTTSRGGRKISEFLGVKYAKAPTGSLRFKSPESPDRWDGVYNATTECTDCVQQYVMVQSLQKVVTGTEDCLCLNVFTPTTSTSAKLPVMVWIHGGAYVGGSGAKVLYGPDLMLDRDIVLVTMNYRLGVMGFISTGDAVIPGNFGMKDQVLALKWVKENIANFGGDINSITLFGESAGGASINLHQYSPTSEGLFHKVIQESGSVFNPWAFTSSEVIKGRTATLAGLLGCPSTDSLALRECLQALPAETIVNTTHLFLVSDIDPLTTWSPTVEHASVKDAFLTEDPRKSTKVLSKPLLAGFNNAEGGPKTVTMVGGAKSKENFAKWNREFDTVTPVSLIYNNTELDRPEITHAIRKFYFGSVKKSITPDMQKQITELYGDFWLSMGVLETVEKHQGPAFLYYYNYNKTFSMCPLILLETPTPNVGACHFDELTNFFPLQGFAPKYDATNKDADYVLSTKLVELWTNFAKSGNPSSSEITWNPVKSKSLEHLVISKSGFAMSKKPIEKRRQFWKKIVASAESGDISGLSFKDDVTVISRDKSEDDIKKDIASQAKSEDDIKKGTESQDKIDDFTTKGLVPKVLGGLFRTTKSLLG